MTTIDDVARDAAAAAHASVGLLSFDDAPEPANRRPAVYAFVAAILVAVGAWVVLQDDAEDGLDTVDQVDLLPAGSDLPYLDLDVDGLRPTSIHTTDSSTGNETVIAYTNADLQVVQLRHQAATTEPDPAPGDRIALRGREATFGGPQSSGIGASFLSWFERGRSYTLSSAAFELDELVEIAEALVLVGDSVSGAELPFGLAPAAGEAPGGTDGETTVTGRTTWYETGDGERFVRVDIRAGGDDTLALSAHDLPEPESVEVREQPGRAGTFIERAEVVYWVENGWLIRIQFTDGSRDEVLDVAERLVPLTRDEWERRVVGRLPIDQQRRQYLLDIGARPTKSADSDNHSWTVHVDGGDVCLAHWPLTDLTSVEPVGTACRAMVEPAADGVDLGWYAIPGTVVLLGTAGQDVTEVVVDHFADIGRFVSAGPSLITSDNGPDRTVAETIDVTGLDLDAMDRTVLVVLDDGSVSEELEIPLAAIEEARELADG